MPLGAAIGAAGGLISQWIGGRQQKRNINRTNQANINMANLRYKQDKKMANTAFDRNMQMQEYAFDKNLEMWKLKNQYNSPEQQMQRFEDAGLSKHMIYGQGTPGNATGSPTMGAATYTPPSYQPPNLDYRGTPSEAANVLGSITGATRDLIEISNKKEQLEQAEIQTWIMENTKYAKQGLSEQLYQKSFWEAESSKIKAKVDEIKRQFWEKGISPTDATWLRIATQVAEQFPLPESLRKVFRNLPTQILKSIQ